MGTRRLELIHPAIVVVNRNIDPLSTSTGALSAQSVVRTLPAEGYSLDSVLGFGDFLFRVRSAYPVRHDPCPEPYRLRGQGDNLRATYNGVTREQRDVVHHAGRSDDLIRRIAAEVQASRSACNREV